MYDLAILGGGPAGYVAAENAGAKGLKVVLFEKREKFLHETAVPDELLLGRGCKEDMGNIRNSEGCHEFRGRTLVAADGVD